VINDILDYSKIESGRLDLEEVVFDVRGLVDATARALSVKASESGVELICDVRPDVPAFVRGDPGRLRQVLTNLIGNAIKFAAEGEVVVLAEVVDLDNGTAALRLAVTDTGIGIPAEKLESIFEEFNQVDVSTSRKFGGSGLGLAISTKLLGLMGSKIEVASQLDRGSEFSFVVNLEVADSPEEAGSKPRLDSIRGTRVLVVDDHPINRRIVREVAGAAGAVVGEAPDAKSALLELSRASADGGPYDLGIIDGYMPDVDGFGLVEKIRADSTLADLKLMMLTSGGRAGDGQRCRDLGMSAYLPKPVSGPELLEAMARLFGSTASPSPDRLITRHTIEEGRSRVRVLLAEDNIVNQKIATALLRKRGHDVDVVENGREAVNAVCENHYDVVLMDVQMPELDGWAATREIRKMPAYDHLPIVALPAHAGENEQETCRTAGMDGYLSKPFKPHELFAIVEGWGATGVGLAGTAPEGGE